MEIEYIRASGINTYMECASKYYFQYIEKFETYNKLALAFGTSIHRALQENFVQKVFSKEDLPLEAVKDIFSSVIDNEFQTVDPMDFDNEKPGQVKDSGIELIEKYHKEVAYRILPVAVEQKIRVKFKNFDYGLSGTIDLRDIYNTIVDHKSSAKDFKSTPESYRIQLNAYALLVNSLSKTDNSVSPVQNARIDFLIRKSEKSSGTHIRNIAVEIDTDYFLNVFGNVSKGIKADVFPPNRQHIYCTRRFCKFWKICQDKYGGRVRD